MITDLRLALRSLRRDPWLAAAAIASIALGIGANTAIFSVLYGVVLSPLPYRAPDRLVMVWETSADNPTRWVAPANFVDWRRESRSFDSLAAFDSFSPALTGIGEAERLRALSVSGTFFTTLGAEAMLGRTLLPEDDRAGAPRAAVLSEALWTRLYGASPEALGRSITLDGRACTIVGIMPAAFRAPLDTSGIDVWLAGDRGVPATFPFGGDVTAVRDSHIIFVVARLKDEVSVKAAQDELTALMGELARRYPDTNSGLGVNIVPLHEAVAGETRPLLLLLQAAVAILLLIACANVAHLLLVRAAARHTEIVTRMALGAGRARLVRQSAAEALVIALPGGVIGIALASAGIRFITDLAPVNLPRIHDVDMNGGVLFFALALTLATTVVFGAGPAFQTSGGRAIDEARARVTASRQVRGWHHGIVVFELALAQVLLVASALLIASFLASQRVELGFETRGRVAVDLSLAPDRYLRRTATGGVDTSAKVQFVEDVMAHVGAAPGARAVGVSFTSPLSGAPNRGIAIPGRISRPGVLEDAADFQVVTPDFFRAAGMALIQGRGFDAADRSDTVPVAIVNQAFADMFFPGERPIGRQFTYAGNRVVQIVGVVADARYRFVESPADPTFFLPITQNDERWPFLSFTAWTDGSTDALATLMREAIRRADPNQPVTRIQSYDAIVSRALAARRFNTTLVTLFAITALLLAAIGTYSVMAYMVSTRTRELGLRAALGARPVDLVSLVLRQGVRITALAVFLGLAASVFATRLMAAMLYGVQPQDPSILASVAGTLAAISLLAIWLPASRAVRVAPIDALRE